MDFQLISKMYLITKSEVEALAFAYDPDLDDDDDGKMNDYIDIYRKELFILMRIIEFLLRTDFSIG